MSEDDSGSKNKKIEVEITGTQDKEELQRLRDLEKKWLKEREALMEKASAGETLKSELDQAKNRLQEIAQQEFEEKKTELVNMVEQNKNVLGKEKYDEFMTNINSDEFTPEKLDRAFFMVKSLMEALDFVENKYTDELTKKGYDLNKPDAPDYKEKKKPTGIVSLSYPKRRLIDEGDVLAREYADGDGSAILDLYTAIREEKDPIRKRKLEKARDKLWEIMIKGERDQYNKNKNFTVIPEMELD